MTQRSTMIRIVPAIAVAMLALSVPAHAESGIASYYQGRGHGGLTCAHKTAPFGTHFKVTRIDGRGATSCVVNDRGPYGKGFVIDLSIGAARQLGIIRSGITMVRLERM